MVDSARSIISRTAGSCPAICFALVLRQGVHVEQQRLLDLGVVEEVAEALRGQLRMVRQHDRRSENRPVLVAEQHGEGVDGLAGERRLPLRPLPLERRDEATALDLEQRVGGDQAVAKGVSAGDLGRIAGHLGLVVDAEADPGERGREQLGAHRDPAAQLTASSIGKPKVSRIGSARQLCQGHRTQLQRPLGRLVSLASGLQEEDRAGDPGVGTALEHGLEPEHRERGGLGLRVVRRVDDPEGRRASRSSRRACRDRGRSPRRAASGPAPRSRYSSKLSLASSSVTAASSVGAPSLALSLCSASSVSR